MKRKTVSLNGTWRMGWCAVGTGTPEMVPGLRTLPYEVPGDVHTPLIEAGLIGEPLEGLNSLDCRWVEGQEFWCERVFTLAAEDMRAHMELTFEGLDCTADVYLNGQRVGRHDNAFVEVTWDVARLAVIGENRLLVRVDEGLREAKKHDLEDMGMMWNNDQPWRVWMRKPQFVYGWDWTIWLASCGIWKGVSLSCFDRAAIRDVYARAAQEHVGEGQPCRVEVTVGTSEPCAVSCRIVDREGREVAGAAQIVNGSACTLTLTVPSARLWWVNGMGEPYLYTVTVDVTDAEGRLTDSRTQRFGLRTVALTEPELGHGESGFTFVLNGERVFCKGANHVPCDCLPGRITAEKERRLVALARDEHMNMLRVWGGGVYASEALMDTCDEAGIMVWHDFMYACGYYPDHDPGFVASITDEARKAICRLRRHVSLIGWAGNNEIQEMYASQKTWRPSLRWYGGTIYERILPDLVRELCPSLIYRESSPMGGEYQADTRRGDQHIWKLTHVTTHPHYLDLWRFPEYEAKFLSEFGVMGAMTLETAESCIPTEHMRPDDPVWLHHTNSCQDHTLLDRILRQYFGDAPLSPQQYILRSQAIQAEVTRHLYEEYRRRKFVCSGLLFWTLSDSYGVHNWSLIDYQLRRKPIYHALRRAMEPLALCVKGPDMQTDEGRAGWRAHWAEEGGRLAIWGMNDTRRSERVRLEWVVMTLTGEVLLAGGQEAQMSANQSVHLADVTLNAGMIDPARTVFRARLTADGAILHETKYFFAPFAEMVARDAAVRCDTRLLPDGRVEAALTADRFVWMLHIAEPDGVTASDNDFDLWPGETRTVTVTGRATPELRWMGREVAI